jgi:hypothetical protein
MPKIWTNSGDSHFLEPADLWESRLPKRLADLTPKAEKDPDGEYETVRVDGQTFRRKLPASAAVKFLDDSRRPWASGTPGCGCVISTPKASGAR